MTEKPLTRRCTFPDCKRSIAADYEREMCLEHVQITDFLVDAVLRRMGIDPNEARREIKETS